MIAQLVRIQKEIARLLNQNIALGRQGINGDLVELAVFVNRSSPFEVTQLEEGRFFVRHKRTLEEIKL